MQQYFVNTLAQPGETIAMTSEQAHHIRRVMRMQQGDVIRVADNSGQIMLAEVEFQKDGVQAHILKELCDHSKNQCGAGSRPGHDKRERNGIICCRKVQSWVLRKLFPLYPAAAL